MGKLYKNYFKKTHEADMHIDSFRVIQKKDRFGKRQAMMAYMVSVFVLNYARQWQTGSTAL